MERIVATGSMRQATAFTVGAATAPGTIAAGPVSAPVVMQRVWSPSRLRGTETLPYWTDAAQESQAHSGWHHLATDLHGERSSAPPVVWPFESSSAGGRTAGAAALAAAPKQ